MPTERELYAQVLELRRLLHGKPPSSGGVDHATGNEPDEQTLLGATALGAPNAAAHELHANIERTRNNLRSFLLQERQLLNVAKGIFRLTVMLWILGFPVLLSFSELEVRSWSDLALGFSLWSVVVWPTYGVSIWVVAGFRSSATTPRNDDSR